MTKMRVVRVNVEGRPAMNGSQTLTSTEHVAHMAQLVRALFAISGVDAVVDRSVVRVEFLVVGGWAMAAHGHQRATKDLDLFVRASPQNAPAVLRSLERFGAPLHGLDAADFAKPGIILQVGAALRIDVTTTIDGVDFDEASVGRVSFDVDGATVFAIGFDALLHNKRPICVHARSDL
jgi:hypothetical protein